MRTDEQLKRYIKDSYGGIMEYSPTTRRRVQSYIHVYAVNDPETRYNYREVREHKASKPCFGEPMLRSVARQLARRRQGEPEPKLPECANYKEVWNYLKDESEEVKEQYKKAYPNANW